jgi:hypothetical protein
LAKIKVEIFQEASLRSFWQTSSKKEMIMTAEKELRSWDILREPNRILLEEDYGSKMELLIYTLTWAVELGLCFALAIAYLRG